LCLRQHARNAGRVVPAVDYRAIRPERGANIFAKGFENAPAIEDVPGTFVDKRKQRIQLGFAVGGRRTTL